MRFHVRSWDARVWVYLYLGCVRITVFQSSWFLGKRKSRSILGWAAFYLGRFAIVSSLAGLMALGAYHYSHWFPKLVQSIGRFL